MLRGDDGDAAVDFVLVGALLTVLTLSVIQLGLALLIRNTVLDAAAEGARYAALADNGLDDGVQRTRDLITSALGADYAGDIDASYEEHLGTSATVITVRTPLPLIGLLGLEQGMEVQGHAAVESLE
jgi:Flp pilus assembly protein TadG